MPAAKKRTPPNLENYVEVADRIELFYKAFPNGSLQSGVAPHMMHVEDGTFLVYQALAYRTPDDPRPGVGYAWEPVPGRTPYTRNSELMNAETSAWGRAIAALGIGLTVEGGKARIASMQEVALRAAEDDVPAEPSQAPAAAKPAAKPAPTPAPVPEPASEPEAPILPAGDLQALAEKAQEFLGYAADQQERTRMSGAIKLKLVALGVQNTSGKLPEVLGRIPNVDAAMKFQEWLYSEIDALSSDAEPAEDDVPEF